MINGYDICKPLSSLCSMNSVITISNVIAAGSGLPQDPSPHPLTFSNRVILPGASSRTRGGTVLWWGGASPAERASREQDVVGGIGPSATATWHIGPQGAHACTHTHTHTHTHMLVYVLSFRYAWKDVWNLLTLFTIGPLARLSPTPHCKPELWFMIFNNAQHFVNSA